MRQFLPYGRQSICQQDIDAVVKVLKSDYLTQGPAVVGFEKDICDYVGADFAVACSNGTAALHLSFMAAEFCENDYVIVPAITFAASANGAKFTGAEIVFADINQDTACISANSCRNILESKKKNGKIAIVTVDLAGHPCDMQEFINLRKEFDFFWVHDACHSIGAHWYDEKNNKNMIGNCNGPDVCVFSFHPVKHITTGEGGMVVTNDFALAEKLKLYRTHGITKDKQLFKNNTQAFDLTGNANMWYYEMQSLGNNYRMSDIQAALGSSQLKKLSSFINRRRKIAALYRQKLADVKNIEPLKQKQSVGHAYHLFICLVDFATINKTRNQVMNELKSTGVGTQVHYIPLPLMPFYQAGHSVVGESMRYYEQALSIPCFPDMKDADVDYVVKVIDEVLNGAKG